MRILLPGEPVSQKRPRVYAKGAMDPCWHAKEQHKSYIKQSYPAITPVTEPVHVSFMFVYEYRKSLSKKKRRPHFKETSPDVDNLTKYIMDMGNGFLWKDDSVIASIFSSKIYSDTSFTVVLIQPAKDELLFNLLALIGGSVGEMESN